MIQNQAARIYQLEIVNINSHAVPWLPYFNVACNSPKALTWTTNLKLGIINLGNAGTFIAKNNGTTGHIS